MFLLICSLFASPIDCDQSSFVVKERVQERIDTFDFSAEYAELKNIAIDAKRKKNVELLLTGIYPQLKTVQYEGRFGQLKAELTGAYPLLEKVGILCGSTSMNLDCTGEWHKSCTIDIKAEKGTLVLKIPNDVGVEIHTQTTLKSKVELGNTALEKLGHGWLDKTYVNALAEKHPVVLHFNLSVKEGRIILHTD